MRRLNYSSKQGDPKRAHRLARLLALGTVALLQMPIAAAHAQGILTVTPGRTSGTVAGTGRLGYSGDGGNGSSATLAAPSAVAYDAAGNLFIADTNNHAIREVVKSSGTIVTVAGTGAAGFSGDGGPATSAQLDTPAGIVFDANGNLYIADSHNHRVRKVNGGIISTVAGTGAAGFAGDGAAATLARLNLPSAVALDASGALYIADTNNQRVRKVSAGNITTIAGNGEQLFAGDGGAALNASLDSPTGVAVDANGNILIADRHNHRIRLINSAGTITTLAGSGAASFAGGFSGDGAGATASALAKPTGVSVDTGGNIYIADTDNQRIRQLTGGTIATIAGNGDQGFSADGSAATGATLNAPKATAADPSGAFAVADTSNQRVRSIGFSTLSFASGAVGMPSPSQLVTLSNSGSAPITVSTAITGAFTLAPGGSCGTTPITLVAGASCTENIAFVPGASGRSTGTVTFSGNGVVVQTVLLAGTGLQATTTTALVSSVAASLLNQNVVLTATVRSAGSATGSITFFAGGVALGTAGLAGGSASLATNFSSTGSYNLTAVYSGDANFGGSASAALAEVVSDFNFALTPGAGGSTSQSVVPGQTATFSLSAAPVNGPFGFPVTLTATGLPPGATVSFTPATATLGSAPANFTMTVGTAHTSAALHPLEGLGGTTLALVLLPFAGRLRRRRNTLKPLMFGLVCFASLTALTALTGCGTSSGFFGQKQQAYTINVIATANGANGATLQHAAPVQLTVQ